MALLDLSKLRTMEARLAADTIARLGGPQVGMPVQYVPMWGETPGAASYSGVVTGLGGCPTGSMDPPPGFTVEWNSSMPYGRPHTTFRLVDWLKVVHPTLLDTSE